MLSPVTNERKVLVFGGTGFLGSALSRHLRDQGFHVSTVARHPHATYSTDLMEVDSNSLLHLLQREEPQVVINLVGCGLVSGSATDVQMSFLNGEFPQLLTEALGCLQEPKLIHVASSTEPTDSDGTTESLYSRTKSIGTSHIRRALDAKDITGTVIILHNTYGPTQPPERFVRLVFDKAIQGDQFNLQFPDRVRDFIYLDDALQGLSAFVAEVPETKEVELGTGEGVSLREVAHRIYAGCGSSTNLISEATPKSDPFRVRVAVNPALIVPKPRNIEVGIEQMLRDLNRKDTE